MHRRSFIAVASGIGLSGCTAIDARNGSPDDGPEADSGSECEDDLVRLPLDVEERFDVRSGEAEGLSLTTAPERVAPGDAVTVSLRNESDDDVTTGTRDDYAIQRQTDDGWEHVFWVPDEFSVRDDVGVIHAPGEGFDWSLTLSPEALGTDHYSVCGPISPGTYRFVYFGLVGEEDPALATEFDVSNR